MCARSASAPSRSPRASAPRSPTDWEAAIGAPGVDAVDVCLPTPLHRPVAERALAAGKHVLLEKPIALTLEDADAIGAAAEASGRVLMVGHVLRYLPGDRRAAPRARGRRARRPLAATALRLSAPPDWNDWMLDPTQLGRRARRPDGPRLRHR